MARKEVAILTGTEYEIFEKDFRRAIRTTWEAIAPDVISSCADFDENDSDQVVEITLDANHVEAYGGLTGDAEIAWKKFYRDVQMYPLMDKLAKEVLY